MKFQTLNQLHNEVKDLSDKEFVYIDHRLGLRGAAIQIMDMFAETVIEYVSTNTLDADQSLDVMYSTYADGEESFFKINGEEMEGDDAFVGDFFDTLPEVVIIIHGSTSAMRNLNPGQSDAIYSHDFQDMHEAGEVDVTIRFPEDPNDIPAFFKSQRKELIGLLAHEMQHAVQKLVYGIRLSEHAVQDLQSHIADIFEVDARVEEVLARLPENVDEEDAAGFLGELDLYIDQYLDRNASGIEDIEDVKNQMLNTHLLHYNRKLGKDDANK